MCKAIYSKPPQEIPDINDCHFYHTMDIPNYGVIHGEWDLRGREAAYLGNVNFRRKTVLEIGTASGHLCFFMEREGAEVVAYDLSEEQEWDIVPYAKYDYEQHISMFKEHIRRVNNSFWFAHNAYNSKAKVVYGTVYEIPEVIGKFDICTLGSILLHLRDPFLALQRVSSHAKDTIIITDLPIDLTGKEMSFHQFHKGRLIRFLPDASTCHPFEAWWQLSPELVIEFIRILGFEYTELSYHKQKYQGKEVELYTIVGRKS